MAETNAVSLAHFRDLPTPGVVPTSRGSVFMIGGITSDQTKYAYTIAALNQDTAVRLLDLLRAPPTENKYEASRLASRLASRRLLDSLAGSVPISTSKWVTSETGYPRS